MYGCNSEEPACTTIWEYDAEQITAYAATDSGWLSLTVFNPTELNAISLKQSSFEGDFDIAINHLRMDTSYLEPQFRLEVFNLQEPSVVSGVALHTGEVYTYVDAVRNIPNIRLIHEHDGNMRITRRGDLVTCSFQFGTVSYSATDTLPSEEVALRLVFGSLEHGEGRIRVLVDDLMVTEGNAISDDFSCQSW